MLKKELVVTPLEGKGERLDVFLSKMLDGVSRACIQAWIEGGQVLVDGAAKRSSHRLRDRERLELTYELSSSVPIEGQDIPLDIIHCDEHVLVVDKPSGMVVHPGAGQRSATLVHALLFHFPELALIGPADKPGIVHRLDKETSGVILVARTQLAYSGLQRQFKEREVDKLYLGLVWGKMPQPEGKITWAIGRHGKHGDRMSVRSRKSRLAETHYKVQKSYREMTLLEIKPLTGRTHQIRVHLSAAGHPIVGDPKYGTRKSRLENIRLFLHARSLSFVHPESGLRVCFSSPLPSDLSRYLERMDRRP